MTARALVFAINHYPDDAGLRPLQGAVGDAIDFASWALDPLGGNVAPANLHFWVHPQPALPANLAAYGVPGRPWPRAAPNFTQVPEARHIITAIEAAAQQASRSGADERLYVFVAGHGVSTVSTDYTRDSQSCFVAGDFINGTSTGLVPLDDLRRLLERTGPKESLLISDCCRNDQQITIPTPVLNLATYVDLAINQQWMLGKAAQDKNVAYEVPANAAQRGAFSLMLIQGLRQYRVDNELTVDDLKGFVRAGVAQLVAPRTQIPALSTRHDLNPYVIVTGPPIGRLPDLHIAVPAGMVGDIIILDLNEKQVGNPIPIQNGVVTVNLPPGQYIIEHAQSEQYTQTFHFGPGPTHVQL